MSDHVCGVDIKGSMAICVLLEGTRATPKLVPTKISKIPLGDHVDQACIRSFRDAMASFLMDHGVKRVCVRGRVSKGGYSAGGGSFKAEAVIQLMDIPVDIVYLPTLKAAARKHPNAVEQVRIRKYQEQAFWAAFCMLES